MDIELSNKVGAILGRPVSVNTEDGALTVLDLTSFQFLLHTSSAPKAVTAEWIVTAAERKVKVAADVRDRRVSAAAQLRAYMAGKGIQADGVSIYFTSTGFSVENLFRNGMDEAKRILAECAVAYKRLEYSPAHWVVRVIL